VPCQQIRRQLPCQLPGQARQLVGLASRAATSRSLRDGGCRPPSPPPAATAGRASLGAARHPAAGTPLRRPPPVHAPWRCSTPATATSPSAAATSTREPARAARSSAPLRGLTTRRCGSWRPAACARAQQRQQQGGPGQPAPRLGLCVAPARLGRGGAVTARPAGVASSWHHARNHRQVLTGPESPSAKPSQDRASPCAETPAPFAGAPRTWHEQLGGHPGPLLPWHPQSLCAEAAAATAGLAFAQSTGTTPEPAQLPGSHPPGRQERRLNRQACAPRAATSQRASTATA